MPHAVYSGLSSFLALPGGRAVRYFLWDVTGMASATVTQVQILRDWNCQTTHIFKKGLEVPRPYLEVLSLWGNIHLPQTCLLFLDSEAKPLGLGPTLSRIRPKYILIPLSSTLGLWFSESSVLPLVPIAVPSVHPISISTQQCHIFYRLQACLS